VTGFSGGVLHPMLVPAHAMAIVALALLIAPQRHWIREAMAFAVGLMAGLGAIALAYVPTSAENALLVLAAALGLLVAWARPLPWMAVALLGAATGCAIGLDSPPESISVAEANRTLLGTVLSAVALLVVLAWLATLLRRDWQRIGIRVVGSWIAASAIIVLALMVVS